MTPSTIRRALGVAAVVLLIVPLSAAAQTHALRVVDADAARRALVAAEAEAKKNGWAMSIAVVDPAGELIAFLRMDGASPGSIDISRAKARTAARFRRATKVFEESVAGGRTAILSFDGVVTIEGGVPIVINGEVVGAVGVSGASSAQDGVVAAAAVAAAAIARP